jgi:hypothetical protein
MQAVAVIEKKIYLCGDLVRNLHILTFDAI